MRRLPIYLVSTFVLLCGCSEPAKVVKRPLNKIHVYKGVVEKVDTEKFKNNWYAIYFEGGLEVTIRCQYETAFYMGRYQEITVDEKGNFVSNQSESYDELARTLQNRPYMPPTLMSEIATNETPESDFSD